MKVAIMTRMLIVVAAVALAAICSAAATSDEKPVKIPPPVRDGFVMGGVDGTLTKAEDTETWFFAPEADFTDGRGTIKAGQQIELLPSNGLEKIAAAMGDEKSAHIKIWARVTRYCNRNRLIDKLPSRKFINRKLENKKRMDAKFLNEHLYNRNYLFAIYFIPMTEIEPEQPETPSDTTDDADTDEDSIIPKDVLEQLSPKRVVNLAKITEALETGTDVILANRTGFVVINDKEKVFTIDGLGRNVDDMSFKLLDCETLEWTEKSLVETPIVRQRFRVSGVITTYKGIHYMLLQRTTRTYSHGNFSR